MKEDKITLRIIEVLKEFNGQHSLSEKEILKLALIICAVVKSEDDIRTIFYAGIINIVKDIQEHLKFQREDLLKKIKDDDEGGNNILN